MLTHPTLEQLNTLGLTGMACAWRDLAEQDPNAALNRDEWLALMLEREASTRAEKRFANRLRTAKLRFPNACIEDIDFAAPRGLDRRNILALAQGGWLKAHENLILTGQTGTGKTWLGCAFGHQAARLDHSVAYMRMPRLFEDMAMARLDGRFPRLVDKLARVQLLILDDWGTHSLTDQQRLDLLEIFEERYQRAYSGVCGHPFQHHLATYTGACGHTLRIPGYVATHSDNIWPLIPEHVATH
jgi:DNA replication protein DnaC